MTTELLDILFKEEVTESVGSDAKTDEKGNIPTDQRVCSKTFYFLYVLNQYLYGLYKFLVDVSFSFLRWKVYSG